MMKSRSSRNNSSNSNRGLLALGLAAGAALGYYLNTTQGRRLRQQAAEQARTGFSSLSENVNHAVERGRNYASEIGSSIRSGINNLSGKASEAVQKGEERLELEANKAQRHIQNRTRNQSHNE